MGLSRGPRSFPSPAPAQDSGSGPRGRGLHVPRGRLNPLSPPPPPAAAEAAGRREQRAGGFPKPHPPAVRWAAGASGRRASRSPTALRPPQGGPFRGHIRRRSSRSRGGWTPGRQLRAAAPRAAEGGRGSGARLPRSGLPRSGPRSILGRRGSNTHPGPGLHRPKPPAPNARARAAERPPPDLSLAASSRPEHRALPPGTPRVADPPAPRPKDRKPPGPCWRPRRALTWPGRRRGGGSSVTMCGAASTEPVPAPRAGTSRPAPEAPPTPRPFRAASPRHWPGALSLGPSPPGNGGASGPWGCGARGRGDPRGEGALQGWGALAPRRLGGAARPRPVYSLPPWGPPDPGRGHPSGGAWCRPA